MDANPRLHMSLVSLQVKASGLQSSIDLFRAMGEPTQLLEADLAQIHQAITAKQQAVPVPAVMAVPVPFDRVPSAEQLSLESAAADAARRAQQAEAAAQAQAKELQTAIDASVASEGAWRARRALEQGEQEAQLALALQNSHISALGEAAARQQLEANAAAERRATEEAAAEQRRINEEQRQLRAAQEVARLRADEAAREAQAAAEAAARAEAEAVAVAAAAVAAAAAERLRAQEAAMEAELAAALEEEAKEYIKQLHARGTESIAVGGNLPGDMRRAQRYFDTADDLCPANPSNELRAGDTIDRVARAFMLYLRYAEMVLNTLKKYGSEWAQNASKSVHNKRCMLVLQRLEAEVKPKLKKLRMATIRATMSEPEPEPE